MSCCPVWSTRTSTSTIPAAPIGKASSTATRAAAAGGITTLVDMPLNSIPATTTVAGARGEARAPPPAGVMSTSAFWGGVVPGNAADLAPLARAGVLGFKCFLSPSGVDEFPHVGEADLREAMPVARARSACRCSCMPSCRRCCASPIRAAIPRRYATWLDEPAARGGDARRSICWSRLAREFGARVHIVHLASADALPAIATARAAGVPITVETCPHYLTFCAEEIADGATAFKCAPPIRERDHRERLWQALAAGAIDLVATDHSPAPPALKRLDDGDFVARGAASRRCSWRCR